MSQKPSSNKIRIKTYTTLYTSQSIRTQKPSSNKIRIKTNPNNINNKKIKKLRNHLPTK